MPTEIEAEAAAMQQAMERAVHLLGCGDLEEARRLLPAHLAGVNACRELLRAYERNTETAERCHQHHVRPRREALLRGDGRLA
jgi:hypothetical protein